MMPLANLYLSGLIVRSSSYYDPSSIVKFSRGNRIMQDGVLPNDWNRRLPVANHIEPWINADQCLNGD